MAERDMAERDMTEPGRAWMRGDLPSDEYFAMVRREATRHARAVHDPGWVKGLRAWWQGRRR